MTPLFLFFTLVTLTATLLPQDEVIFEDDDVELQPGENLDLSDSVTETLGTTTETIGGQEVELAKKVKITARDKPVITITNAALPTAVIKILDDTTIKSPQTWDGLIKPPTSVSTSGTITGNFLTPTTAISVGSPDVILVFDKAVTILLTGTTGQTAYKTPGSNTWILISGCTGTYATPNDPPANGECSISNGVDTKILTFHFTEFTSLSTPSTPTSTTSAPSTSSGSSGGHGKTGVGSPRIYGSSGGSSGGGVIVQGDGGRGTIPAWFDNVMDWYRMGEITPLEFINAYDWIIRNIVK